MTFKKNCFQSEILRTVNSTSSFSFVHLAKNYGALHFTEVYNSVFRHDNFPGGEAVTSLLVAQIDFVPFKHNIRHNARLAIFGCILYNVFGEGSNSVIVSGRLANLIMISEEHRKNDEILFQNVYGHRESVVLRVQVMLITYSFCDFLLHWYPCMTKANVML